MRNFLIRLLTGACLWVAVGRAADLKEAKFTQVVNDVQVISTVDNAKHSAAVGAPFKLPDVVRTGAASRAELVAEDRTITRVGANTIFSFDNASRSIHLDQGSLLFNAPKGKGGGSIHTAAATAAVLGTTIIVTTTKDGGFKVLVLEDKADVLFPHNIRRHLRAGQMIFVLPGGKPGPVLVFRLDQQIGGSLLVNGFSSPLPSLPLINLEISRQLRLIQNGQATDTGLLVGGVATPTTVQTVTLFDEVSASPGAGQGNINGLNNTGTGAGTTPAFSLPPGLILPPGVTFDPNTGAITTADGLVFIATPPAAAVAPAAASLTDVSVNNGPLDPLHLFSGQVLIGDASGTHPNLFGAAFNGGFVGKNVTFSTTAVDLSPFAAQPSFSFLAAQDMTFNQNVNFTGSPAAISFSAGGNFIFGSDAGITTDAASLSFNSTGALALNGAIIKDLGNSIFFNGTTSLDLNNTPVLGGQVAFVSANTMTLTANGSANGGISATTSLTLAAATGMTIGVDVTALTGVSDQTANIFALNQSGLLTVNNGAHFTTDFLTLQSLNSVLVDNTTISVGAVNPGSATISGGNAVGDSATVQNTSFDTVTQVNIMAHTVVLNNVDFAAGSTVKLMSNNGLLAPGANTSQAVQPGFINYITKVTYGGADAVAFTGAVGSGKPITTSAIP